MLKTIHTPTLEALRKGSHHAGMSGLVLCFSLCLSLCASLSASPASAAQATPGAAVSSGNVEVSYNSPDKFTEMERYPNERTNWLDQLSNYVAKRASRTLPAGQKLSVTITDVQLAGTYEPWRLPNLAQTRTVRDTTPPRIDLQFKLESATGELIKEGDRKLRDLDFLHRSAFHRDEPLSHEKNLIDAWLAQDFGAGMK
jgi:Protein of unknown function (DUF3016)